MVQFAQFGRILSHLKLNLCFGQLQLGSSIEGVCYLKKASFALRTNMCIFCSSHIADLDQLQVPLNCPMSCSIQNTIAADLGLQIGQSSFGQFNEARVSIHVHNPMRKKLCIAAFFVVSWGIWMQRNKIIFELYDLDPSTLCHTIKWRIALMERRDYLLP